MGVVLPGRGDVMRIGRGPFEVGDGLFGGGAVVVVVVVVFGFVMTVMTVCEPEQREYFLFLKKK